MHKALFALAACALGAAQCHAANSITPYGALDVGVATQSNATPAGTKTGFIAGTILPDILGISGSHELPSGNKVIFRFEAGTNMETGAAGFSSNNYWGRNANVGLAGRWGSVTGGMELTPFLTDLASVDPLGLSQAGSILDTYVNSLGIVGIFDSRMIQYRSPALGGFGFTLGAGTGNVPGNFSSGREIQGTAHYTRGGLELAAGALHLNGNNGGNGDIKSYWLGAAYDIDQVTLKGVGQDSKVMTNGVERHTRTLGLGLDWSISDKWNLAYGIYQYKDLSAAVSSSSLMNVALLKYALDSQTSAYVGVTHAANKGLLAFNPLDATSWGNDVPAPGISTTALYAGFYYTF